MLDAASRCYDGAPAAHVGVLLLEPDALARMAFDAMADKQATDLVILDLRPVSNIADFFVIGSAASERQIRAVQEAVSDALREDAGVKAALLEGEPASGWVLGDYDGVIVHIFSPERRAYYDLESLWDAAPLVARMA